MYYQMLLESGNKANENEKKRVESGIYKKKLK